MDRKAKRGREDDITSPDAKALRRDEDRFTGHRGNQQLTPPPSGLVSLGGFARASPNELARRSYVKQVRVLLLKARGRINMELADWALQQQQQRQQQTPGKLLFYGDATQDYLSKAHNIQSLYERTPGMVASSGSGDCGQLGLGEDMDSCNRPRLIKGDLPKISRVVCGGLHTLGIAANGALYAWGCNDDGSLGRDDLPESTVYTPVQIKGFRPSAKLLGTAHNPQEDFNIVHAAAGDVQTMVVTASGNVFMFGAYKSVDGAQLRDVAPPDEVRTDKDAIQRPDQTEDDYLYKPAPRYKQEFPIHLDMPGKVLQVFCGASFSAALLDDGSVVTWGIGEVGELGRPTETPIKTDREYNTDAIRNIYLKAQPPIFLDNPTLTRRVLAVGCGSFHMLLVVQESGTSKRAVYSTGLNNYGQLGLGDINNRESLTRVEALDDCNIDRLAAGNHHSMCLDASGQNLYTWGRADYGQIGNATTRPDAGAYEAVPVLIDMEGEEMTQISCGGNHNLVLTKDGNAYSWGYGDQGALGLGIEDDQYTPCQLKLPKGKKFAQVEGGGQHSAFIIVDDSSTSK